jgi:hypothetical protein
MIQQNEKEGDGMRRGRVENSLEARACSFHNVVARDNGMEADFTISPYNI